MENNNMLKTKVMYSVSCSECGKVLKPNPKSKNIWFDDLQQVACIAHDYDWECYWDYHKVLCPSCQNKGN